VVKASDGKDVAFRTTQSVGAPKAIIIMQQGTYGQPQFFDGMGEKLAEKGIKSYAVGSRVETTDYHIHADDLNRVVAQARKENPGVPITVMGVSLGAMIALDWNAEHNPDKVPVVLMSPVVLPKYLGLGDLLKVGAGLFSKHFAAEKVDSPMRKGARLTTNPASAEDHLADAKNMKVPANLFDDVVKMAAAGAWNGRKSTGPLLVMEAGADQVAANWATGGFMHLIGSKDKTVKSFAGAAHDLSQESHRPDVVNGVADWVLTRPQQQR
jgi:alpha-beta hydrolase superfamily lysophospholipase